MKTSVIILISICYCNVVDAQSYKNVLDYLASIDTINIGFLNLINDNTDSDDRLMAFKFDLVDKISSLPGEYKNLSFDTLDINSFSIFKIKYENCKVNKILLLTDFNYYLVTLNSSLEIINLKEIGINTPTLYNAKTKIGVYQRTKLIIENCDTIKSIQTSYSTNSQENSKIISRKIKVFIIDPSGKIMSQ